MNRKKLDLGFIVATQGVNTDKEHNPKFHMFIDICLRRHERCDWGNTVPEDKELNDLSLETGDRIISTYKLPKEMKTKRDRKIWIITEADRSATTVLYPSEY